MPGPFVGLGGLGVVVEYGFAVGLVVVGVGVLLGSGLGLGEGLGDVVVVEVVGPVGWL